MQQGGRCFSLCRHRAFWTSYSSMRQHSLRKHVQHILRLTLLVMIMFVHTTKQRTLSVISYFSLYRKRKNYCSPPTVIDRHGRSTDQIRNDLYPYIPIHPYLTLYIFIDQQFDRSGPIYYKTIFLEFRVVKDLLDFLLDFLFFFIFFCFFYTFFFLVVIAFLLDFLSFTRF